MSLPAAMEAAGARSSRIAPPPARTGWRLPVGIAVALHLGLLAAGCLSRHDTLLDLIAKGGVEAQAAPESEAPAVEQEVELVDLAPPPEPNPEFVQPEEEKEPMMPEEAPPVADTAPPAVPQPPVAAAEPVPPAPAPSPDPAPPMATATTEPASPAAAPAGERFAPSGVVLGNRDFPKPPYPYEARQRRFQGTVVVSLNVVDGKIVGADVASSSGYGVLDAAATGYIRRKWRFPAEVTRVITQPISFELADGA